MSKQGKGKGKQEKTPLFLFLPFTLCPAVYGGEGGIRTHGTVPRSQHFQCCQFNHSCTSPAFPIAHCQLAARFDRRTCAKDQLKIGSWKSAMLWRRGWDSNPR